MAQASVGSFSGGHGTPNHGKSWLVVHVSGQIMGQGQAIR